MSKDLAKSVPDSFSVKLQRKLASSVPPRPVVSVEFVTAFDHLERICRDGKILTEVLDYHDSQSLMVSDLENQLSSTDKFRPLWPYFKLASRNRLCTFALCFSITSLETWLSLAQCLLDS